MAAYSMPNPYRIWRYLPVILVFALFTLKVPAQPSGKQPIKISLWDQDPPEVGREIDKWIAVFEKQHPHVDIVRQNFDNEELRTKFLRSSVTGDGADLLYGPNDLVGVLATAGVIQPINDLVKPAIFSDRLIRLMTHRKQIWGYPISAGSHLVLYYNRQLIKEPPESMAELIREGKAFMNQKSTKGRRYGLAYYQSEPFWFIPFMSGFGAWPLATSDSKVQITLDQPGTRQALEYVLSLKNKHKIIPADCDFDCAKSLFVSGRAPFHINGDWQIVSLKEKLGHNLGIAALPKIDKGGHYMRPMAGGRFFFVSSQVEGRKRQVIKDFMQMTSTLPVQIRLATKLKRIPATRESREHEMVRSSQMVSALIDAMAHAKDFPSALEMRAAWDGMRIMIQRAMTGRESPEQAAATGQQAATEALKALRQTKATGAAQSG
jgi:maltose-binding protein MalE